MACATDVDVQPELDDDNVPNPEVEEYRARSYQLELFEKAVEENTIVCLKTGAGKTYIAVMLIKEYQDEVLKSYEEGKRTFFLVPKVPLVIQQAKTIVNHTILKVGHYYGAMGVDLWNKAQWKEHLEKNHVFVMTAQILLNMLNAGYMPLSKINLIVFDECHKAIGKHPYCGIMSRYQDFEDKPRILGLTASILSRKCKPHEIVDCMEMLEKTLHCRIQTSRDLVAVNKYSTKPKEVIVVCDDRQASMSPLEAELRKLLDTCGSLMVSIIEADKKKSSESNAIYVGTRFIPKVRMEDSDEDEGSVELDSSPHAILKKIYSVVEQLGLRCAIIMIDKYIEDLPKLRRDAEERLKVNHVILYDVLETTLNEAFKQFQQRWTSTSVEEGVTPKVKRLLQLLRSLCPTSADAVLESFRGILFVEGRVVAWILSEYLKEVIRVAPLDYDFLKPCFVVGHGVNLPFLKRSGMKIRKQNDVLESFRSGERNLMVATNVAEEGLDIPKCNLVVRFDPPKEFCSYVQSMGRARAEKALYVLLVPQGDLDAIRSDIVGYKIIEVILNERCDQRFVPTKDQTYDLHARQHKIEPFYPTDRESACLTMNSALTTLNMYVTRLPCDRYTTLQPVIDIVRVDGNGFRCFIRMPVGCPFHLAIAGEPMRDRDDAKRAAAFQVCKLLHEMGELNDHLLPCSSHLQKYVTQLGIAPDEVCPLEAPIPGTNRRRLIYDKRIADDLYKVYPKADGPYSLHVIHVRSASIIKGYGDQEYDAKDCYFGILTSKPIGSVCPFYLYEKSKYIVSFERKSRVNGVLLSDEEFARLEAFHQTLFGAVLRLVGSSMLFQPEEADLSFLIVPVQKVSVFGNDFEIDWGSVKWSESMQLISVKDHSQFVPEVGSVVRPIYGDESIRSKRYIVLKVLQTLTTLDIFECTTGTVSYKSYFQSKYDVRLQNETQPLLEVCYAPNAMNLLLPSKVTPTGPRKAKPIYLIPELVRPLPLRSNAFKHAFFLPSILHRLNGLLVAGQLTNMIVNEARIVSGMCVDECTKHSTLEDISNSVRIDNQTIFISPREVPDSVDAKKLYALIFQALTTRSAGNRDDLERLELIGDSFLKFVVSVFLYCEFCHLNEGYLSALRTGLIKNYNLSYHAKAKNIPEILNAVMFQARINWMPPGYVFPQSLIGQLIRSRIPPHLWPFASERPLNMSDDLWRETLHARWLVTDGSKRDSAQQPIINLASNQVDDVVTDESVYEFSYDHYKQHLISDKTVADSVEAMIGAVLASCGQAAALRLINWFGLRLDTQKMSLDEEDFARVHLQLFHWNPPRKTALLREISADLAWKAFCGLDILEEELGYKFNDKSFLREAIVHPSLSEHPVTGNYQRLEFLGDAILDYLITMNVFKANPTLSPGDMTDLRSSLVDNATFAFLTVKCGLHKHLRYRSVALLQVIDKYIVHHAKLEHPKDTVYLVGEDEVLDLSDVEVPKALGDVFESVAGAIYVDSGFSLETVWNVVFPIMKELIGMYTNSLPINPVRKLLEHNQNVKFSIPKKVDSLFVITTELDGKVFTGRGRTKMVARQAAAKCALRGLKLSSNRQLVRPDD